MYTLTVYSTIKELVWISRLRMTFLSGIPKDYTPIIHSVWENSLSNTFPGTPLQNCLMCGQNILYHAHYSLFNSTSSILACNLLTSSSKVPWLNLIIHEDRYGWHNSVTPKKQYKPWEDGKFQYLHIWPWCKRRNMRLLLYIKKHEKRKENRSIKDIVNFIVFMRQWKGISLSHKNYEIIKYLRVGA